MNKIEPRSGENFFFFFFFFFFFVELFVVVSKKTCEKNQKKKNKGKKKKNMLAIQRARIAARGAKRLASQFESDGKERVYVPGSV
jgi:cell division protein FtsI/penicillin-binding protein 2